jgi:hypothetical protein
VVGRHDDQRLVVQTGRPQPREQLPEQPVGVLELQQVALLGLLGQPGVVEGLVAVEAGLRVDAGLVDLAGG